MALPQARHDAHFRLLVSDPARAGRLLRDSRGRFPACSVAPSGACRKYGDRRRG